MFVKVGQTVVRFSLLVVESRLELEKTGKHVFVVLGDDPLILLLLSILLVRLSIWSDLLDQGGAPCKRS